MRMSESIKEISIALAKFQAEVKQPDKDGNNPHFRSKYVTLDGTVKAIHDCAPNHGLSYTQMPITTDEGVGVITILMHISGEFIQFEPFILPMEKKSAQGAGSGITYARRYSLSSAFGIVSDLDDDGNEISGLNNSNTKHVQNANSLPNYQSSTPKIASEKQLGLVNVKIEELVKKANTDRDAVYRELGIASTKELTSSEASAIITKLNNWIERYK